MLYSNYEAELFERVCADLHTYVELFNPMKEKINKRRRKLLDYDNAKHGYEIALSAKKRDDVKISKVCLKDFCQFLLASQRFHFGLLATHVVVCLFRNRVIQHSVKLYHVVTL